MENKAKKKVSVFNSICAALFVAALFVCFAINAALFLMNRSGFSTETLALAQESVETFFGKVPGSGARDTFFHIFGAYNELTNRSVVNNVVILNDGRMVQKVPPGPSTVDFNIDVITTLNNYLSGKGTPLLFVRVPDGMRDNSQLPIRLSELVTVVEDTEYFLQRLSNNGVSILDLRREMIQDGVDFGELFFHGDHHWNAKGALYGYGKIGELLNSEYGFNLDAATWDIGSYTAYVYPNAFNGSLSDRTNGAREDITALIPTANSEVEVTNIDLGAPEQFMKMVASGSFADVFVPLTNNSNNREFSYNNLNAYRRGLYRYTNRFASESKKILFVADSFGLVPVTYLTTAAMNVDYMYLDNRYSQYLYHTLARERYDIVIFMLYDYVILEGSDDMGDLRLDFGQPVD